MKNKRTLPPMHSYPVCAALQVLAGIAVIAAFMVQERVDLYVLCILLAFALILGSAVLYKRYADKARREIPITVVRAQVVSTRKVVEHHRAGSTHMTTEHFYTTFQPEGGEPIEFQTGEMEQNRYPAGTWGTLRYQGWQYLSFMERDIFLDGENVK